MINLWKCFEFKNKMTCNARETEFDFVLTLFSNSLAKPPRNAKPLNEYEIH